MRTIPPPRNIIGETLLNFWRTTPVLQNRFPDTESGATGFIMFCIEAAQRRLEQERMG